MSNIEDILYEARDLGIYKEVMDRIQSLRAKSPYANLDDLYDKAFEIEKNKLNGKK